MWKLIGISSLGDCKSSTILGSCWSSFLSQKVFVFMPFYSAVEQLSAPVVCCRPSIAPAALVEHRLPCKQICWWLLVLWSAWGFSDFPRAPSIVLLTPILSCPFRSGVSLVAPHQVLLASAAGRAGTPPWVLFCLVFFMGCVLYNILWF